MGESTEVVLFRWHSGGSVFESVAKAVSVADFEALDVLVKARWGAGVVTVKSYVYDERIDWDTQLVCHDDRACGYTSRPFPSPPPEKKTMTDPTAADMERARERAEQFMSRVVLEWDKEPLENWKVLVDEHVEALAEARAEGHAAGRAKILKAVVTVCTGCGLEDLPSRHDCARCGKVVGHFAAGRAEMAGEVRKVIQASIDDFEALMIDDPDPPFPALPSLEACAKMWEKMEASAAADRAARQNTPPTETLRSQDAPGGTCDDHRLLDEMR